MSETTDIDSDVLDGAKIAPETILPAGYRRIKSFCGASNSYAVFLCNRVPEESDSKELASKDPKSNKVVIVKFACKNSAEQEIKSLKLIKDALHRNTEVAGHFVSLLDHNKLDDAALKIHPKLKDYQWLSIEAVIPSFSFNDMLVAFNDDFNVLQALPLEFFTQMCSVLSFLHKEANIAHGDLHGGNIMVRFIQKGDDNATESLENTKGKRPADKTERPTNPTYRLQFVLIDFGHSAHIDENPDSRKCDVTQMRWATVELCDPVQEDIIGDLDWDEIAVIEEKVTWTMFTSAMRSNLQMRDNIELGKTNDLRELEKWYGDYAKNVIKRQRKEFDQSVAELLGRMQENLDDRNAEEAEAKRRKRDR